VSVAIVGVLLTRDGLSSRPEVAADWSLWQRSWASPATALRRAQPPRIPLDLEHDPDEEIGQVVSLFRSGSGDAWAVATSEADRLAEYPEPLYFSAGFLSRSDPSKLVLDAVALTPESATVAKRPVEILRGSLERSWAWQLDGLRKRLVEHAAAELRERSKRRPILIHDELPADEAAVRVRGGCLVGDRLVAVDARVPAAELNRRALDDLPGEDERPAGKLRWRPSRILGVR
jgi:hypothetical protein